MKPLLILTRSNRIESIHSGHVCITDSKDNIIFTTGDENTKIFLRSSAKPFIAVALVKSGALEKYNITEKELAIICASHSGEDFHRDAVQSILNKIGLSEENLKCGIANPYNDRIRESLIKKDEKPSQLYNCCSGKHSGMLTLCKFYDFPIENYNDKSHPAQKLILKTISEILECDESEIIIGVDGCTVPSFMISLCQLAYLYSQLAAGKYGMNIYKKELEIIKKAMINNPKMVMGPNGFCTEVSEITKGKVIGKIGDEGVYCISIPYKSIGIAIKIADGNERASHPTIVHLLKQLNVLTDEEIKNLKKWNYPPVKNHKGEIIGHTIPIINMENINEKYEIGQEYKFEDDENEGLGCSN